MLLRKILIILTCLIWLACNQTGKYYDPYPKDVSKRTASKRDSLTQPPQPVDTIFNAPYLQLFCNNEVFPYCILLPLDEFKEDYNTETIVKTKHKFVLKEDSTAFASIELQAFTIDRKNYYNTLLFYQQDKKDLIKGGLGIDTAYIDKENHLYCIKGHLPNYMNMKFVQLNWILEDRITVYINYLEKDKAIWENRLAAIILRGIKFNNQ
jgi:hypothetical protein